MCIDVEVLFFYPVLLCFRVTYCVGCSVWFHLECCVLLTLTAEQPIQVSIAFATEIELGCFEV